MTKGESKSQKREEFSAYPSLFSQVSSQLDPIAYAQEVSKIAADVGFEFPDVNSIWEKFKEESSELEAEIFSVNQPSHSAIQHELGDCLFALCNLARLQGIEPAKALQGTVDRFIQRFETIEKSTAKSNEADLRQAIQKLSLDELQSLWQKAKKNEK